MIRRLALLCLAPLAMAAQPEAAMSSADAPAVLENELIRVTVSPVGARITGLYDKVRNREDAKNLPYVGGMNEIRYGTALNFNEAKDRYALKLETLPDGTQKLTALAAVTPDDDRPGKATLVKEYRLSPGSAFLALALEIRNEGADEIGLFPWVRHLINRGLKEQPEESFMTENGAYLSGQPFPDNRSKKPVGDAHFFPAGNWTARVVLPLEDGANTLVTLTRPPDVFKLYNWHRKLEDFATQEMIGAPLFAKPGETARWNYGLLLAAPVRNIVYASPDLVIGASPHPTWLTAGKTNLELSFAATRELAPLTVEARLLDTAKPDQVVKVESFTLTNLSARTVCVQSLPIDLEDRRGYQLRLSFKQAGQPYFPGSVVEDRSETLIPLVAGTFEKEGPAVFPGRDQKESRLRRIQPQARTARKVFAGKSFDAFAFPGAQRCFRGDTFSAAEEGPLTLFACAGEYESAQLVLTPKTEGAFAVEATALAGPGSNTVACESINDFLYVPVRVPSLYNALFPLGDYPEALLPVETVTLTKTEPNHPLFVTYRVPENAAPGRYRGSVVLAKDGARATIPVELTVWDVRLPKRDRRVEYACSLKGNTLTEARHDDGPPYSRQEQLDAIVDMHLKYRLTPCDSGLAALLLRGEFEAFEKEMAKFEKGGATKVFLGQIPAVLKTEPAKLAAAEQFLRDKGWTDYFYVRPGFDEASPDLAPQIKAVCQSWKAVSKVPIMETYYPDQRAEELFGSLDIWSRNPPLPAWTRARTEAGDRFWKVNAMPAVLEVDPWISGRKRYWGLWDQGFTGSYIWTVKAWSGVTKWGEDYWCDGGVGNLSAVLMWPHETGILSTIRLEAMRDGLEETTMLWMLRDRVAALAGKTPADPQAAAALADARALCSGAPLAGQIKSAADLQHMRIRVGSALSALNTAFPANP